VALGVPLAFLMPTLREQLDPRQPLKRLAEVIPWSEFKEELGALCSEDGRRAKPVRLIVARPTIYLMNLPSWAMDC
jgi:hypothetical protein